MERKLAVSMFGQKRLSREGGIEIVAKELCTRMVQNGCSNVSFKNNGKLKLLIIVGTRPEIIRLAAVINKTRKYFDVILAHTGQNYDYNLNGVFFHDLQLADKRVIQHEPLGFHDYNCLQMNAFCVVSDSGTLPEESSFFRTVKDRSM